MNKRLPGIMLMALLLAAGCGGPKTLVVIAPDQGGKVGAVSLSTPQGETVLDKAYAAADIGGNGSVAAVPMNEQEVKAVFADALAARPDPPLSFTLYFREGTNELTPESKQRLADITREISRRGSKISEVTVVGHTDRVGKLEFNDRLSLQRSRFVVDELVSIGVDRQAITASGRGEREPVVITEDEVPEARNRRVEVSVR
mgnify:CR=1 FL=1